MGKAWGNRCTRLVDDLHGAGGDFGLSHGVEALFRLKLVELFLEAVQVGINCQARTKP